MKLPITTNPPSRTVAMTRTACLRNNTGKNAAATGNITRTMTHCPFSSTRVRLPPLGPKYTGTTRKKIAAAAASPSDISASNVLVNVTPVAGRPLLDDTPYSRAGQGTAVHQRLVAALGPGIGVTVT